MPVSAELTEASRRALAAGGFDLCGVVSVATYNGVAPASFRGGALLPEARAALVLGASRVFFERAPRRGPHPMDAHTENVVRQVVEAFEAEGDRAVPVLAHQRGPDGYLDMVELGIRSGLGFPSRLGLLLHPDRGPWWSLRAAILTTQALEPGRPLARPSPCQGCPAPCLTACPGAAPQPGGFDLPACARVRASPEPCGQSCAARRACVVGTTHSYDAETERYLMESARTALLEAAGRPE